MGPSRLGPAAGVGRPKWWTMTRLDRLLRLELELELELEMIPELRLPRYVG